MKVLLKEDVDNLGYTGEVLKVADGYGRNYLIPRGLAVKASPGVLKQAHEALSLKINDTNLNFTARAGETGKLYGSITTADVTEQLNEVLGTDVDRRLVTGGPLRQLGEHRVTVRLSRDYQPQILVQIHPFSEVESEEDEAEVGVETADELETAEEIEATSEETTSEEEISEEATSEEETSEEESVEVEETVEEIDEPAEEIEVPEANDEEAEEED